jgi:tRNA1Val (adenine37-N6)-methyltransferase
MPNSYFSFKQFTIQQDRTAMKVCTDSCILGAWTALRLGVSENILDIGSGTGLLPLMLAQKSTALMDTIETDTEAAAQAKENISASNWAGRIRVIEGDARNFVSETGYDFIISNPPFYESDLHSPEQKKNNARHEVSLSFDELLKIILSNLRPSGAFSILLPFHRTRYFENLATQQGFLLQEKLIVRQTPKHDPFRSICLFIKSKSDHLALNKSEQFALSELIIKDESGKYSVAFTELMKDYYG